MIIFSIHFKTMLMQCGFFFTNVSESELLRNPEINESRSQVFQSVSLKRYYSVREISHFIRIPISFITHNGSDFGRIVSVADVCASNTIFRIIGMDEPSAKR